MWVFQTHIPFETVSALYRFPNEVENLFMEAFASFFWDETELIPSSDDSKSFEALLPCLLMVMKGFTFRDSEDSLRGKDYFRLSEVIDDTPFSICRENYRKWIEFDDGEVLVFPFQNILKSPFGLPKINENIDRSIIMELFKVVQDRGNKTVMTFSETEVTPDMNISRPVCNCFRDRSR